MGRDSSDGENEGSRDPVGLVVSEMIQMFDPYNSPTHFTCNEMIATSGGTCVVLLLYPGCWMQPFTGIMVVIDCHLLKWVESSGSIDSS